MALHPPQSPSVAPVPSDGTVPQAHGSGGPGATEESPEEFKPRLAFLQQPTVQHVLPFVTSLSIHAGIIILGFVAASLVNKVGAGSGPGEKEQTIIPEATLVDSGPPGGVPNQGPDDDRFNQMMQDITPDNGTADGVSNRAGPTVDLAAAGDGAGNTDLSSLIGLGANGGLVGSGRGGRSGRGDSSGNGDADGGPLAKFGAPGGGAIGPHGLVFGNCGNARQIVFVCDASGSMLNKMATLKDQLQKVIGGLKAIQTFNIIFFQDERCVALDKTQLISADPNNKRAAYKFLDEVTTAGQTDPIPGLTLAFAQQPQLIYLLTDGDFPDNKAVRAKIADLNRDHKVKINTIAFTSNSDTDTEFLGLLEEIAKESGGTYRHVAENKLND